ncbi:MAG TPA: thermonuclease family protein [Gaiellaceae bacterium]|nr:thermonuclease family protein [Gaiellaceae bacterium]
MRRALAAAAAALALAACASGSEAAAEDARVARVVDGDTIELATRERVRLVQIDAPEAQEDECYAAESTAALDALLPRGAPVRLEADPRLDDTDRFGRLLRYVHRGDVNVNLELVRRGAASVWFFDGDRGRYADELVAAARAAEEGGLGLWSACPSARLAPERGLDTGD